MIHFRQYTTNLVSKVEIIDMNIESLNLSNTHTSKNPSLATSSTKKASPPIMSKLVMPSQNPKKVDVQEIDENF